MGRAEDPTTHSFFSPRGPERDLGGLQGSGCRSIYSGSSSCSRPATWGRGCGGPMSARFSVELWISPRLLGTNERAALLRGANTRPEPAIGTRTAPCGDLVNPDQRGVFPLFECCRSHFFLPPRMGRGRPIRMSRAQRRAGAVQRTESDFSFLCHAKRPRPTSSLAVYINQSATLLYTSITSLSLANSTEQLWSEAEFVVTARAKWHEVPLALRWPVSKMPQ